MKSVLVLTTSGGEAFVNTFHQILCALPLYTAQLDWRILELYGEGDVRLALGRSMDETLGQIESEGGLRVSWNELLALSKVLSQLFDLTVVGIDDEPGSPPPRAKPFEYLCSQYAIVIEAFDSFDWRIGGTDETVARKLAAML